MAHHSTPNNKQNKYWALIEIRTFSDPLREKMHACRLAPVVCIDAGRSSGVQGVVAAAHLCGCPEATIPGEVVALGAASALALLLAAAAPAAGEEDDTEESGDRAPGCRSLAVRIRHGAGDGGCCFLEPRQSPNSSSSSSSSPPEFSSTSSAAATASGGGSPAMKATVGPAPPPIARLLAPSSVTAAMVRECFGRDTSRGRKGAVTII